MSGHGQRGSMRNYNQYDLFDWARERELRAANPATRRIAKRFGLSLDHATTVATLAGIHLEIMR